MPAESDDDAARHYSEHDVCHIYTPVCPPVPSDKGVTVVASVEAGQIPQAQSSKERCKRKLDATNDYWHMGRSHSMMASGRQSVTQ